MTSKTANLPYYEVAGEGAVIVLGHAGFVDCSMWDDQWQALTQHHRVIRYDMRGYGQSGNVTEPVSRRNELKNLLKSLNVTEAHFIGSSLSGSVFIDLAIESPSLVKSLVVIGAVPNGFVMQGEPPRYMMEMFGAWQAGDLEQVTELQMRIWIDGIHREPEQVNQEVRQRVAKMNIIPVQNRTMLIADYQPIDALEPSTVSQLNNITCPTLVIDGGLDHPEVHRASALMAEQIPNALRRTISDTAHMPNLEKPTEFNRIILDFLNSIR